ncbi:hypothetical protein EJB05_31867, partial [Eragrostis curvula]
MPSTEVKTGRNQKSSAARHLNVAVAVGVLLVLLTYLVVSQQFAFRVPYVVITKAQHSTDKLLPKVSGEKEEGKVVCSSEGHFSESCEINGDVRVNGTSRSVFLVPTSRSERQEWKIRPYPRKEVEAIKKVTVTQLPDRSAAAPHCTATYAAPAVLFALGGLTGNIYHDYADVLVPLFVASRRYDGEVQFLVANLSDRPWWPGKYKTLLRRMSKYDVVDLDADAHVRCFRHLTLGLHMYKEFTILPDQQQSLTMTDFTRFQREAYGLPRHEAANLARDPNAKPRLMLLHRGHYRKFVNEQEVVRAAEAAGFEVEVVELRFEMPIEEQARLLNSFDVLLGMHGAGLTTEVFMPPGGVLIQVVPFGKLEFIARVEYDEPAADMGLKYIDYHIGIDESTLPETLGPDHPAVRDPDSVHRSGWLKVYEFYLQKQDIRVNITRFAPTLAQAMDHLRRH